MDRVTTDLQNIVMKVRMVPVSSVFNRFPRMVRDIAKELNKEINLTIEGEETELDRTVIDEIGDPIMHLLRNSCDHGVEEPDVREASRVQARSASSRATRATMSSSWSRMTVPASMPRKSAPRLSRKA